MSLKDVSAINGLDLQFWYHNKNTFIVGTTYIEFHVNCWNRCSVTTKAEGPTWKPTLSICVSSQSSPSKLDFLGEEHLMSYWELQWKKHWKDLHWSASSKWDPEEKSWTSPHQITICWVFVHLGKQQGFLDHKFTHEPSFQGCYCLLLYPEFEYIFLCNHSQGHSWKLNGTLNNVLHTYKNLGGIINARHNTFVRNSHLIWKLAIHSPWSLKLKTMGHSLVIGRTRVTRMAQSNHWEEETEELIIKEDACWLTHHH